MTNSAFCCNYFFGKIREFSVNQFVTQSFIYFTYFVALGDLKVFDDKRANNRKDTADNDEQVDLYFS